MKKKTATIRKTIQKREEAIANPFVKSPVQERYEFLLNLYETLKNEGITRIADLENKIANAQKAL